ncbi:MAG: M23 family metallopeptidase, partial [Chloroflexota bacterium]
DALGVTTLYGHLLNPPPVMPGQFVEQGQLVGLSGDPDETCDSRPHLHFEVRSLDYSRTINPAPLIDANWHNLALIGPYSFPLFQHNLQNPRQWVSMEDQPDVTFWGQILNNYSTTYPVGFAQRPAPNPIPARTAPPLSPDNTFFARRLTENGCCALPIWDAGDGDTFYVMDGAPGAVASVFQWSVTNPSGGTLMRPAPLPYQSPHGVYDIEPFVNNTAKIRTSDYEATINTGGRIPTMNPTNTNLLWADSSDVVVPGQQRPTTTIFVSGTDGADTREIFAAPGADAQWLDDTRVLLSIRNERRETSLFVYDLPSGSTLNLGAFRELRGLSVSPGGRYVTFYLSWQDDLTRNGVHLIDTQSDAPASTVLPWFGAWRWRDTDTLYYIPFEPDAPFHTLRHYNVTTGDDFVLATPATTPFIVANGYWEVSADGTRILFQDALDKNIYVLEG